MTIKTTEVASWRSARLGLFWASRSSRRRARMLLATGGAFCVALFWCAPLLLLFLTGLRSAADFTTHGALSWPDSFTLRNITRAWTVGDFSTTYRNSILLVLVKVPLGVLISALFSFALAKLEVPFRRTVIFFVFLGLTVPVFIALVPLFFMIRQLDMINNPLGLVLPYLAFGLPFEVLVLQSFFRRIPNEIMEAAKIDGASSIRIFFRIVVPLSVPALLTVGILDAVATWNEFPIALTMLNSDSSKTLPLGLLNFTGQFTTDYTGLASAALVATVPMLIAYAFLQRFIVSGLTTGAVKG